MLKRKNNKLLFTTKKRTAFTSLENWPLHVLFIAQRQAYIPNFLWRANRWQICDKRTADAAMQYFKLRLCPPKKCSSACSCYGFLRNHGLNDMFGNVWRWRLQGGSEQLRSQVGWLLRVKHPLLFEYAVNPRFLTARAVVPIKLPPCFPSRVRVAFD